MTFANPLPWWALTLVVCAAAALAWLAYWRVRVTTRRRVCLSLVRFITLLLIVILLMRPSARSDENDPAAAVVPVLVDVSRSMAIERPSHALFKSIVRCCRLGCRYGSERSCVQCSVLRRAPLRACIA